MNVPGYTCNCQPPLSVQVVTVVVTASQLVPYSGPVPVLPPLNPALPAIAYDPNGANPNFGWNVVQQAWK